MRGEIHLSYIFRYDILCVSYYIVAQGVAQPEAGKSRPEISGLDPSPRDGRHHREPRGNRGVREDG